MLRRKKNTQENNTTKADDQRQRIARVIQTLSEYAVGPMQREMIEASLLAYLSNHHCLFIGPYGCNKTGLLEKFLHLVGGDRRSDLMTQGVKDRDQLSKESYCFKVTLNKYSQPEALLGAVSVKELRNDRWVHQTANMLPDADFAYVGEIFSGNNPTLNSAVRIFNERAFDNGGVRESCRLRSAFCDTNEEPTEAVLKVYDRLLIRVPVQYVPSNNRSLFVEMMSAPEWNAEDHEPILDMDELDDIQCQIEEVSISTDVYTALHGLRTQLEGTANITISDRRWIQSKRILQASAWVSGRMAVDMHDIWNVMRFVAWDRLNNRDTVLRILEQYKVVSAEQREEGIMREIEAMYNSAKGAKDVADIRAVAIQIELTGKKLKDKKNIQMMRKWLDSLDDLSTDTAKSPFGR